MTDAASHGAGPHACHRQAFDAGRTWAIGAVVTPHCGAVDQSPSARRAADVNAGARARAGGSDAESVDDGERWAIMPAQDGAYAGPRSS